VGYSGEFLEAENSLAVRYPDGGLCRNADGSVSLECTCGLVLGGNIDSENPLFTPGGSAWTNDSLPFLDVPPEDDPRLHPRNRCIHVGFLSIALVPLRDGQEILGLLHFADRRTDRFTPESIRFLEGLGASIGGALAQKRVQEELRESQERLLEAYRLANIGAWKWHADSDTVTWSEELYRIAGLDPERPPPTYAQHADFVAAASWGRLQAAVARTLETGEPYELELELMLPDGSARWVRSLGSALHDDQGRVEGLYGTFQDISASWQAKKEIARALSLLESTMESTADGILVTNGLGRIIRYNVRFRAIWGIPESIAAAKDDDAALGFVLDQLKEPQLFLKGVQDLYAAPERTSFDVLELKDGRVLERYSQPQRIDGSVVGRVWSFRDVTARRRRRNWPI